MKDLKDILDALATLTAGGEAVVLATVVSATGSTYRGPGAHMLVTADGRAVGSISGGCVEHDVLRRARAVLADGAPRLLLYDTTAEDDVLWGMGLGCSGVLRALIERYPAPDRLDYPAFLATCLAGPDGGIAATVYRADAAPHRVGRRLLLHAPGDARDDFDDPALRAAVLHDAEPLLTRIRQAGPCAGQSRTYPLPEGPVEVLLEPVAPPVPLVLFGAGHDVPPLVHFARALGWHVTVVDHRPAYADTARLPGADRVLAMDYQQALDALSITPRTVVLVMTHQYLHDLGILQRVIPAAPAYLGILGPTRRTERLLQDLHRGGMALPETVRNRLYGPAGLDLGAETAAEVALSILAEIQAVLTGRGGGFLRDRRAPIHTR